MGVFLALCACALMQVLLLPIGRGFTGQCLDIGALDLTSAIGGRIPEAVVTFEPREEALRAWQEVKGELMRHCTPVRSKGPYGWTEADDGLKRMWLQWACCYPAHTGNDVSSRVGGVAERP